VPAIKRLDDAHFVWRQGPDGPVSTRVELGRSNLTHVEILDGLGPGDRVLLVPPAGAALPRAAAAPAAAAGSGDGSAR
jgi:multidrug efflux pump subunit AcrA (membrane-fusion protein)